MDFFYNAPESVVDEGLDGLARIAPIALSTVDHGVRVVVDRDRQKTRVAVLSGGGAGHEPAHAGFIGEGMLAGAVVGDLFTSPSVEAVLAAIREICGSAGCLLVIKNYTGDRLNFGLAAERAAGEGYEVRCVIVEDDVALPDASQPRGLAGTVLVHKIAGHYAREGADLNTVADMAQRVCDGLATIGLSLASCTLPGHAIDRRAAELGLGIHNEPGVEEVDPTDAAEAMRMVLEPLCRAAETRSDTQPSWIVMLNNLGSCATQEMGVLLDELLDQLPDDRVACVVTPAPLMTSMDMHGFSVTLLAAHDDFVTALESPVAAIGWPGVCTPRAVATFEPSLSERASADAGARDAGTETRLHAVIEAVIAKRDVLDALDAKAGDGDTGTTFSAGARAIGSALDAGELSSAQPARMAGEIGEILARDMGGSSGVLLSIFSTATGGALRQNHSWPDALAHGVDRMQHYGGAQPGDRTLLDALVPAIDALGGSMDMPAAAKAARQGANETANMAAARAGRAAHVRESFLKGVVDPGAEAMAIIWEALANGSG